MLQRKYLMRYSLIVDKINMSHFARKFPSRSRQLAYHHQHLSGSEMDWRSSSPISRFASHRM